MLRTKISQLRIAFLAAIALTTLYGCSSLFSSISNKLLANETRFDDREPPHTAYAIPSSTDDIQTIGGQGHGLSCSLPFGAQELAFTRTKKEAPIALQMRQACAFHDYCYRHGNATYGYSQADCDFILQQQAFRLCKFFKLESSIASCETNARKITLGVRLGGTDSFKQLRAMDDSKASTFFDFDPYPSRATKHQTLRIADAPLKWRRDGLLPKAAYYFDTRPSGILVHILGWKTDGAVVCNSLKLSGSYDAISTPPVVARDSAGGEDWFVWWQRNSLRDTGGRFALLPTSRARAQDWEAISGGMTLDNDSYNCEKKAVWENEAPSKQSNTFAFVTEKKDLNFSEIHPVNTTGELGKLQLMGLSTHSCGKTDRSTCLVDVIFDTTQRDFQKSPKSPTLYRASDSNCTNAPKKDDCDRYRNYVSAPFVIAKNNPPSLIWTRRGKGNGDEYKETATVLQYTTGDTPKDPAKKLNEFKITNFNESMEPAAIIHTNTEIEEFLSIETKHEKLYTTLTKAIQPPNAQIPKQKKLNCFSGLPASWLYRPFFVATPSNNNSTSYIIATRTLFDFNETSPQHLKANLQIAIASIKNSQCEAPQIISAPSFFKDFSIEEKLTSARNKPNEPTDNFTGHAANYVASIRGSQMVLADVNGDDIPDLIQIARSKDQKNFSVGILIGEIENSKLTFHEFSTANEKEQALIR